MEREREREREITINVLTQSIEHKNIRESERERERAIYRNETQPGIMISRSMTDVRDVIACKWHWAKKSSLHTSGSCSDTGDTASCQLQY